MDGVLWRAARAMTPTAIRSRTSAVDLSATGSPTALERLELGGFGSKERSQGFGAGYPNAAVGAPDEVIAHAR